ncbi:MAG: phosphate ABC transporter permease PstA [Bryobacteraceae bacterium]|nr:phosphate ABC transporter permease PstA [Bryobacteraceae bacterium]
MKWNLHLWRKAVNYIMFSLAGLCTLATVSVLFGILGFLVWKGASSINWDFFTQLPKPVGEAGGGMANAIIGSFKLVLLAAAVGVPVGFISGVYLAEFGGRRFPALIRYVADLLNGVPSIVIGIFIYALVVVPMKRFSTLAGGLALALMMVPVTMRTTEQFLRAVPDSLREAALALGASQWRMVATVVIPASMHAVLTGTLLGVARVAGETAPLLFTAFNNRFWSPGWDQPTASLPVMVFTYAIAPYEDWHRQAWAAGLVLLVSMLALNIAAHRILSVRMARRPGR